MYDYQTLDIINYWSSYSAEMLSLLLFALSSSIILMMLHFFGLAGLHVYCAIATILGNIQVLQISYFNWLGTEMALGTVTFSSIFLASDIITERYGAKNSVRNIYLCLATQLSTALIMMVALAFKSVDDQQVHAAMLMLFLPVPRLVFASVIAFFLAQIIDVYVFQRLSIWSRGKNLWLRALVSIALAGFIDNAIYSWLAWVVLNPKPIDNQLLLHGYIIGSYLVRVLLSILAIPVMYLSRLIKVCHE